METVTAKGLNPVSEESSVLNVSGSFSPQQPVVYATLMLWKKAGEKWTDDELVPVKKIKYSGKDNRVTITFINGESKTVAFD